LVTFDIRKPDNYFVRKSHLSYDISCVAALGNKLAIGSFEGRICIEENKNTFSFKSHYKVENDTRVISSVNSIKFNPITNDLITAGGDGKIFVWKLDKREVKCDIGPFPEPVSSIDVSADGKMLAASISYGFERGPKEATKDTVLVFQLEK
jgi:cell cycle arrest protein BUB3